MAIPEIRIGRIWQVIVGWQEGDDAVGKAVGATGPAEGELPHPRAALRAQSDTTTFAFKAVKRQNFNDRAPFDDEGRHLAGTARVPGPMLIRGGFTRWILSNCRTLSGVTRSEACVRVETALVRPAYHLGSAQAIAFSCVRSVRRRAHALACADPKLNADVPLVRLKPDTTYNKKAL